MSKYNVTFLREFTVTVGAPDLATAERLARGIIAQFPASCSAKLLSVEQQAKRKGPGTAARAKASRR